MAKANASHSLANPAAANRQSRTIIGLQPHQGGTLCFLGEPLAMTDGKRTSEQRRRLQIVFQNPQSTLNPRETISAAIERGQSLSRADSKSPARSVADLMEMVRLPSNLPRRGNDRAGGEAGCSCKSGSVTRGRYPPSPRLTACAWWETGNRGDLIWPVSLLMPVVSALSGRRAVTRVDETAMGVIRRDRRRFIREHHPDLGGDPDVFIAGLRSFGTKTDLRVDPLPRVIVVRPRPWPVRLAAAAQQVCRGPRASRVR